MEEKIYNTMKRSGGMNITLGILMIVFGIVLFHIGLRLENLKIERIKTDMRVERIRRRKSAE